MKLYVAVFFILLMQTAFAQSELEFSGKAGVTPGHIFYGMDRFFEMVQVAFTSDDQRVILYEQFAEERLAEGFTLTNEKKYDSAEIAFDAYATLVEEHELSNEKHVEVLTEFYTLVPVEGYRGIETALEASSRYRPDYGKPNPGRSKPYDDPCPGKFRCVRNNGNGEECLPGKLGGCAHGLRQFCETGYSCCLCNYRQSSSFGNNKNQETVDNQNYEKESENVDSGSVRSSTSVGIGTDMNAEEKSSTQSSSTSSYSQQIPSSSTKTYSSSSYSSSSSYPSYSSSSSSNPQQTSPTSNNIQISSYSNILRIFN